MDNTLPINTETARVQALREHAIMDTSPEPQFDRIVCRAATLCETPIAVLALIDERRQWFKARFGFVLPELPRGIGFDALAMFQTEPLVIRDTLEDLRASRDPLVLSELNIRFYAGVALTTEEGYPIGALSIMDYRARDLSPAQLKALLEQAQEAMLQLSLHRQTVPDRLAEEIVPAKMGTGVESRTILPDVIMRFGRELRYTYVSPSAIETLGILPDSLLGRAVGDEQREVPFAGLLRSALVRTIQSGRIEEINFLCASPSGEQLFQTRLIPETNHGEVSAIASITRVVMGEAARQATLPKSSLRDSFAPADRGMRTLTEPGASPAQDLIDISQAHQRDRANVAKLAHEIQTPLASVMGFANLLLSTKLNPAQRELSEMTRSSAQALLTIVNEALEGPNREARASMLTREAFDLRSLVEEVGSMLAARAHEKGIDLVVRCSPALPDRFFGDAGRVRQILTNLVDNAIKFTQSGYVLIDASSAQAVENEAEIQVEVEDTGIGIVPDQQSAIFDRRVQAAGGTRPGAEGAGLGLAISRELAEKIGGALTVRSQPGKGSVFRFTLRLPVDVVQHSMFAASQEVRGLRALIVGGSALQQYAIRELLGAWGVRATLCSTTEEMTNAMQAGLQSSDPFHVAVLDENTIGSNSIDGVQDLLKAPAFRYARLVLITSVARSGGIERLVSEGQVLALFGPVRRTALWETFAGVAREIALRESRSGGWERAMETEFPGGPGSAEATAATMVSGSTGVVEITEEEREALMAPLSVPGEPEHALQIDAQSWYTPRESHGERDAVELVQKQGFDLVLTECGTGEKEGGETFQRIETGERYTPNALATDASSVLHASDDILDRRALMDRTGGSVRVLGSLTSLCQAECAALMQAIRENMDRSDRTELLRIIQKLRGNVRCMEAHAAAEAARRLELTVQQGRIADAEVLLEPLQFELERLQAAMNAILIESR